MRRKKTKGQILTKAALKITPLCMVVVMGGSFVYNAIMDDYRGVFDLNALNREVVSSNDNPTDHSDPGFGFDFDMPSFENPEISEEAVENNQTVISREMLDAGYNFRIIDWANLKSINEDIVSYISVDGTKILFPVVQSSDNQDYVHQSIYNYYDVAGTPMVDYRTVFSNDPNELSDVSVVYGHHMSGSNIFGDFDKFKNQDFVNAHPFVMMYTDDGQAYRVDIFACDIISGDTDFVLHAGDFNNQQDFDEYMYTVLSKSRIQTDVEVNYGDKIITFITCDYEGTNMRAQVIGKVTKVLVDENLLDQSSKNIIIK